VKEQWHVEGQHALESEQRDGKRNYGLSLSMREMNRRWGSCATALGSREKRDTCDYGGIGRKVWAGWWSWTGRHSVHFRTPPAQAKLRPDRTLEL